MSAFWYERLAPLDAVFLDIEAERAAHMHVGMVCTFEGPAPSYAALAEAVEARLHKVPRYRQRLKFVPLRQGRPVWVDESHFDLAYHVRHTALPAPGDDEQLKILAARLLGQRLDRDKPLWEIWFVEGLTGGRFALIAKTHHCMIDGISGVDIATLILEAEPHPAPPADPPPPWRPRPEPPAALLLVEAMRHPMDLARGALTAGTEARRSLMTIAGGIPGLLGIAAMGFAPSTSLNQTIGPHRRFETLELPLSAVKRVRAALGGTVNDVILAVVAGGLRALLLRRHETPPATLRALVPVSVRSKDERNGMGNQVTAIFCDLPVGEGDPARRLARISEETRGIKDSGQAIGALALTRLGEFTPPTLAALGSRLAATGRFFNLVVTNVPGPQHPLYLLGRRMLASYPVVPLVRHSTLGVAVLSYDGRIGIGLLGDADKARDLAVLGEAMGAALDELVALAPADPAHAAPPPS